MNDATRGADNIRNDINALAQRYAVIDRDEDCGVIILLSADFIIYEYMCGLSFIFSKSKNFID